VLKDQSLVPGRGSLAEVMPDSFKNVFNHAATAFEQCPVVGWTGASGRACTGESADPVDANSHHRQRSGWRGRDGSPGSIRACGRRAAAQAVRDRVARRTGRWTHRGAAGRSATAGTLVHRLFQSGVGDDDRDDPAHWPLPAVS
jgi:hypothetical protein